MSKNEEQAQQHANIPIPLQVDAVCVIATNLRRLIFLFYNIFFVSTFVILLLLHNKTE